MWTLPVSGTLGKKAENLYRNTQTILDCGWKVPRSMVIPFEYYSREGGIYYMLDDITACFPNSEFVAVRSNAPDEDGEERTPGLYVSKKVAIHKRHSACDDLGKVLGSYESSIAEKRRKRKGVQNTGMCLLVQEWIPAAFSGCFSDIGEIGILRFTNPTYGTESMIKPSVRDKLFVNSSGEIVPNTHYFTTYDQTWAKNLRRLVSSLPNLGKKGWELEFVISEQGEYILQTTPIKRQPRFEVRKTRNNIFECREVIGSGMFETNGILYLPTGEFDMPSFDRAHRDYCLVICGNVITRSSHRGFPDPTNEASNARVLMYVNPDGRFIGLEGFAAHAETFIRESDRCGLVGKFINSFRHEMSGKLDDFKPLFLDTKLLIQADEIEQEANVEIIN
jgi:hypothetical protein